MDAFLSFDGMDGLDGLDGYRPLELDDDLLMANFLRDGGRDLFADADDAHAQHHAESHAQSLSPSAMLRSPSLDPSPPALHLHEDPCDIDLPLPDDADAMPLPFLQSGHVTPQVNFSFVLPDAAHMTLASGGADLDLDLDLSDDGSGDGEDAHLDATMVSAPLLAPISNPEPATVSMSDLIAPPSSSGAASPPSLDAYTPIFSPPSPSDSGNSTGSSAASSFASSSGTLVDADFSPPAVSGRESKRARTTRSSAAAAAASKPTSRASSTSTTSITTTSPAHPAPVAPVPVFSLSVLPPTVDPSHLPPALLTGTDLASETLRIIKGPEKKKPGRKKKQPAGAGAGAGAGTGGSQAAAAAVEAPQESRKRKAPADTSPDSSIKLESSPPPFTTSTPTTATSTPTPPSAPIRLDPSLLHTPNFDPAILDLDPATLPAPDRKILRLLKNRASATLSRARRREKLAGLEQASVKLVEENVALKECVRGLEGELARARGEVDRLRADNEKLVRALEAAGSGASAGVIGGRRGRDATKSAVLFAVTLLGVAFLWGGLGEVAKLGMRGVAVAGAGARSHHMAQILPPSSPARLFELPGDASSSPADQSAEIIDSSRLLDPAAIALGPAEPVNPAVVVEEQRVVIKTEPGEDPPASVHPIPAAVATPPKQVAVPTASPSLQDFGLRNITDMFERCDARGAGGGELVADSDEAMAEEVGGAAPVRDGNGSEVAFKAVDGFVAGAETILPLPTTPPSTLRLPSHPPFHLPPDAYLYTDRLHTLSPIASPGPHPPARVDGARPRMQLVAPAGNQGNGDGKVVAGREIGRGEWVVMDFELLGARVVVGK